MRIIIRSTHYILTGINPPLFCRTRHCLSRIAQQPAPMSLFTEDPMWIYVLTYQTPETAVPTAFEKYLENLDGRRILNDVWIVRGNLSAHALVASTRAFLGDDAKIFATEANEDYAVHGIPNDVQRARARGMR